MAAPDFGPQVVVFPEALSLNTELGKALVNHEWWQKMAQMPMVLDSRICC